jgi:hypothetical protein
MDVLRRGQDGGRSEALDGATVGATVHVGGCDRRVGHGGEWEPGRLFLAVMGLGRARVPGSYDARAYPRPRPDSRAVAHRLLRSDVRAGRVDRPHIDLVHQFGGVAPRGREDAGLRRRILRDRPRPSERRRRCGARGGRRRRDDRFVLRPRDPTVPGPHRRLLGSDAPEPSRSAARLSERLGSACGRGPARRSWALCAEPMRKFCSRGRIRRTGTRRHGLLQLQSRRVGCVAGGIRGHGGGRSAQAAHARVSLSVALPVAPLPLVASRRDALTTNRAARRDSGHRLALVVLVAAVGSALTA